MISTKTIDNIVIATISNTPNFNILVTEKTREELKTLFIKSQMKMIIDLSQIEYIDSSGFTVFLSLLRISKTNNGSLKLCHIRPEVMKLFKLLQLNSIFEIYDTLDDGLKSFH